MSSDDPGSKRCPICTHLPIAEVASGHDLDPLIYSFNVETIQQLLDSKIEEQFSGHCDLYRTARFILDFWSKRHDVEQSSDWKMLGVQCDGSKGVVIMTDADSKVDGMLVVCLAERSPLRITDESFQYCHRCISHMI